MASNGKTPESIRQEIQSEREVLAKAVDVLREDLSEAADIAAKLRAKLPLLAGGALGAGFVLAGGLGATARLLFRRGRERHELGSVGRYTIVEK